MKVTAILIGIILTTWGSVALLGWPWWTVPAIISGCFVLGFIAPIGKWILQIAAITIAALSGKQKP